MTLTFSILADWANDKQQKHPLIGFFSIFKSKNESVDISKILFQLFNIIFTSKFCPDCKQMLDKCSYSIFANVGLYFQYRYNCSYFQKVQMICTHLSVKTFPQVVSIASKFISWFPSYQSWTTNIFFSLRLGKEKTTKAPKRQNPAENYNKVGEGGRFGCQQLV